MSEKNIELTRRKMLGGIGAVGVASAGAALGTSAYFSDQESFENNELVAGELDMKVGWDEHYFDMSAGTEYGEYGEPDDDDVGFPSAGEEPIFAVDGDSVGDFMTATRQERFPEGGLGDADPCEALTNLPSDDLPAPLIELGDVKPGDFGEVTFSFALCDNPGYVWMTGDLVSETDGEGDEDDASDGGGADDDGVSTESSHELTATNLTDDSITPEELAASLVTEESGVEIVDGSVTFVGDDRGGGTFSGGDDVIGLDEGVILSSGNVEDVEGPNDGTGTQTDLEEDGDDDLEDLTEEETNDASVLEFEFTVPDDAEEVFFRYVFGSEEYNEFVGSEYNDVFGFFVNGENVALVPDPDNPDETLPAAINNINNGQPDVEPTNPDLYVNNDPFNEDSTGETVPEDELVDTEMDGFTVPLTIEAEVDPGETNTMKLAIADTSDHLYDSWVLIEAETLDTEPPEEPDEESELPDAIQARAWYDADCDNVHDGEGEQIFLEGTLREALDALSEGKGVPLDGDESTDTDFDETGDDPEAESRDCYAAAPDVHCIGFEWWVPTEVGNEIQGDSVEFDLGFYTEQCRHNDGDGA